MLRDARLDTQKLSSKYSRFPSWTQSSAAEAPFKGQMHLSGGCLGREESLSKDSCRGHPVIMSHSVIVFISQLPSLFFIWLIQSHHVKDISVCCVAVALEDQLCIQLLFLLINRKLKFSRLVQQLLCEMIMSTISPTSCVWHFSYKNSETLTNGAVLTKCRLSHFPPY